MTTITAILLIVALSAVWLGVGYILGSRLTERRVVREALALGPTPPRSAHLGNTVARNAQQRD